MATTSQDIKTPPAEKASDSGRLIKQLKAVVRVDQLHDPIHWLRLVAAEHILELPLQRRSLLELRRVIGTPCPSTTANAAKVESGLIACEVAAVAK